MGSNTFIPKTTVRGLVLTSTGNGDQVAWSPQDSSNNGSGNGLGNPSWAIAFSLTAGMYPGLYVKSSTALEITGAYFQSQSGTLTAALLHNGTAISGLNSCSVTTTSGSSPITLSTPFALTNGDRLDLELSALSGAPSGLIFTVVVA
jgi:hypothetical protein